MSVKFQFNIDRGGSFTDCYSIYWDENDKEKKKHSMVMKVLSEDPTHYSDAPTECIRRVMDVVYRQRYLNNKDSKEFYEKMKNKLARTSKIPIHDIDVIRMGTTVATNALLERKGEKFALVTTKGFKDLLVIGNQSRPDIFDLKVRRPDMLYAESVEIEERVVLENSVYASGKEPPRTLAKDLNGTLSSNSSTKKNENNKITYDTITGEPVRIVKEPNVLAVKEKLQRILDSGIKAIAIVFVHGSVYPNHEIMVGDLAKQMGFTYVSMSHESSSMIKLAPRGFTCCADAYLTPHIKRYIETFSNGFDDGILNKVQFMQSDGGLTWVSKFAGHRAILSGPAGGVVGYSQTAWNPLQHEPSPLIGFDMGGTSTDVSRYGGTFEHVSETTTAGTIIQAQQLNINTVAAGGGSRLFFKQGLYVVGPESTGAQPGPVCYKKKGGKLAITDANLMCGRLIVEEFPKLFGPNENEPLDKDATLRAFEEMKTSNPKELGDKSIEDIALGFIRVANETMCRPIRELTQMKGFDLAKHILAVFGGAGGQHCCSIARTLGIKTIFVHRYAGILSAYGLALADLVREEQEPLFALWQKGQSQETAATIEHMFQQLETKAKSNLLESGIGIGSNISVERFLNVRYSGTDSAMMISNYDFPANAKNDFQMYFDRFEQKYKKEYGFSLAGRNIVVDDVRVRVSLETNVAKSIDHSWRFSSSSEKTRRIDVTHLNKYPNHKCFFDSKWIPTPVYQLEELKNVYSKVSPHSKEYVEVTGPAIIIDHTSTLVVEPEWIARISSQGDVELVQNLAKNENDGKSDIAFQIDPIQLSIFSHRFMGIAEQMGRTLQRTSVSVNIKERLDFSCALFSPSGGLVANAPHIPVHLGSMQAAVRMQMKLCPNISKGDVLVSNHPQLAGGSHLPDITVITPYFEGDKILFWVASRGHHADIGGIAPGSMPPLSHSIHEEGLAIVSMKLVKNGVFQEEDIVNELKKAGSRNIQDNISDLRAQVAANQRGINLIEELIREYSVKIVHGYMNGIMDNASRSVREMLIAFAKRTSKTIVSASDSMDDGSNICLEIKINPIDGTAVFDFEGTGPEVFGNINCPPSVTTAAVVYSIRCLIGEGIPLNEGCLEPITVKIPEGSLLNPSATAAVVGGNVLTCQRIVDVVLRAFNAVAASQGCMNNFSFGDDNPKYSFGFYETIAGGAGAGEGFHGSSCVHTHMTNTRIGDVEVLERRYPIIIHTFTRRIGSGGKGKYNGGDGVIREIEFLRPLSVSILSERRVYSPFGMHGGGDGKRGENYLIKMNQEKRVISLGGKNTAMVNPGDRILILTPGGGGWGKRDDVSQSSSKSKL